MSLKMKVGSYYYNSKVGVLKTIKLTEEGSFIVDSQHCCYFVNSEGKDITGCEAFDLEYECDEYGNEVHIAPQTTTPTEVCLELKIDTTDAISSLKELQSELEKVKSIMYSEPVPMQHLVENKLRVERIHLWFEDLPERIEQQDKQEQRKHNHYFKDVSNLNEIDVYAVLTLFEVNDPCIAHAAKKLLCTGNRGHKDFETDVQDAIDSLLRWKELNQCLNK